MSDETEAFRDGASAWGNGATIFQNPYATFTVEFVQWENGWLEMHMNKSRPKSTVSNGERP